MEQKVCSQCSNLIETQKYVVSEEKSSTVYTHIHCFFSSMMSLHQEITEEFISPTDDLIDEIVYSDFDSLLDELDNEDDLEDLEDYIEFDEIFEFEDEINKEFPSAA